MEEKLTIEDLVWKNKKKNSGVIISNFTDSFEDATSDFLKVPEKVPIKVKLIDGWELETKQRGVRLTDLENGNL